MMNKNQNKRILQLSIHLSAWVLIFALPFLLFSKNNDIDLTERVVHHSIVLISLLIVFYFNFFILINKFMFRKQVGKFILINLGLILIVSIGEHFMKGMLPLIFPHARAPKPPKDFLSPWALYILQDLIPLLLTAGLSIAVKTTGKWYEMDVERQENEKNLSNAELMNLRQQINPHFLFNTLNNIYALIAISPEKAQSVVLELSKLLRYILYENNDNWVEVSREMDFIRHYIELMRIRLTEDVDLKVNIEPVADNKVTMAPLLFISLIENAFKHGVSPDKKSFIHIDIHQEDNKMLVCKITNSYFPKDDTDKSGSGIGIENLLRRLELLYPDKHQMKTELIDEQYHTELKIQLVKQDTKK